MDLKQHLMELCETPGLSGYEAPVRRKLQEAWSGLNDQIAVDALGNLIATRHGTDPAPRKKILITAHMDEIGLMVTRIEGAFLRVTNVGDIDRRVLPGQPVLVHGEKPLPGLIGSRPPHVLPASERKKYPHYEDLVVDTGLSAAQLKKLVQIGAPVTFDLRAVTMGNDLVSGKALDNRASVAMLTHLLHELQPLQHRWDVVVAAAVQEEINMQGSETLAWHTRPDIAIVVDTTWAIGTGVGEDKGFKLSGGPTLIIGPNAHPRLFDMLMQTAGSLEIKVTPEPAPRSSGTDAWAIQISRDGIPTAIFGIPIRNMHSPVEVVSLKDIKRVTRIVAAFIGGLDDTTLDKLSLDAAD